MDYTILSVAGKPGLYKLVSRAKMNLIVEALDETHRRVPVFASDRVTSLSDIAMYTNDEDVPLMNILSLPQQNLSLHYLQGYCTTGATS